MADFDPELYKRIGNRIREERSSQNLSQADLAAQAHLSLPQISLIERGSSNMLLSSFVGIVEALQVSADSLLRANNPESKNVYAGEIAKLIADCTPAEMESILKIVAELKHTMRLGKENNNN